MSSCVEADDVIWVILAVLVICIAVMMYPMLRGMFSGDKLARDAGWKRIGFGVYRTGPWGGPYVEPHERTAPTEPDDRTAPTEPGSASDSKPPTRPHLLLILAGGLVLGLPLLGAVVSVAAGQGPLPGLLCGLIVTSLMIGAVWILRGGRAAGHELRDWWGRGTGRW